MKLLKLHSTILVAALIASQGLALCTCLQGQSFGFGKKKSADSTDQPQDGSTTSTDTSKKADPDSGKAPEYKEKHRSKEEIKEEEELTAEYEALQKELSTLLKTVKTPFGGNSSKSDSAENSALAPLTIAGATAGQSGHDSIRNRLLGQAKLYMPARMMIGRPVEFTIKGRPGYWAALAMADRDKGAKPIFGHDLRLGPDRKVVALGKIPLTGVLPLKIFAPIEGDLVGSQLYFEAAVWPENKPEQMDLALPVSSETQQASTANSVAIIGTGEKRHGLRFVPDGTSPYSRVNGPGIGSGSL